MSTDTVLVASSVYSAFRETVLSILQNPVSSPSITRMITTKSAERIRDMISDAITKGATLHTSTKCGASLGAHNKLDREFGVGAEVPAIIVEGLRPDMIIYTEESFGPLLSIMPMQSPDEAVGIINSCRYGLSAAIHTQDHYKALFMAKELKVGAIHINGATVHDESTLPHGGYGDSGWGRFGAGWGLAEFVQTKTVVINK
jgi:acyl-CoA reductase-like NAD-dependent aldehyde dehydrogenase